MPLVTALKLTKADFVRFAIILARVVLPTPGGPSILRLEVEAENEHAVHVYRKSGFEVLPYMEMKK